MGIPWTIKHLELKTPAYSNRKVNSTTLLSQKSYRRRREKERGGGELTQPYRSWLVTQKLIAANINVKVHSLFTELSVNQKKDQ